MTPAPPINRSKCGIGAPLEKKEERTPPRSAYRSEFGTGSPLEKRGGTKWVNK